jgi:rSAM/selenodomain-associated transferase 2
MMIFDPDSSILVVFCRRPAIGSGKQRIAADLGKPAAYEVAKLLLAATLEDALAWPGPVVLSPATATDAEWAAELLPDAIVIPQDSGNLGSRIQDVQTQIRTNGGRYIIFIGSDSPYLTQQLINDAFTRLRQTDTVFIPALDGGVTLMGSRQSWPNLADLPWETPELGNSLKLCCQNAGLTTSVMETGFDIDTCQDLTHAIDLLATDPRPTRIRLRNWIIAAGLDADSREMKTTSISVVIPVLNDLAALTILLQRLRCLQPGIDEIVVVDASISHDCRQLCDTYNAKYLDAEPNRGTQLGLGAKYATGDILWFLHADSSPPAESGSLIREHIAAGHSSGYFHFGFDGTPRWYKNWLQIAINLRARFGIPYGDQGLFVEKSAYKRAGGHTATPLFEEVALIKQLRHKHSCTPVAATIGVSSRRWERDGWLQRSLHNRYLAVAFALGVAPERLARQYGQRPMTANDTDSN